MLNSRKYEDNTIVEEQEKIKRLKMSNNASLNTMHAQINITPEQRASKLKKLESENLLLRERIANMEKMLQQKYNASKEEQQILQNNRFGAIMDNEIMMGEAEQDNEVYIENSDDNNNSYETIKRAIKRKNTTLTDNRTKQTNIDNTRTQNNNKPVGKTNIQKLPPLHIHNQNIKDTVQLVKGAKIDNFEIRRVNNNKHSLITNSIEDYEQIKNIFKEVNTNYFTFTPKDHKPKTIILKGLNEDEEVNEIKKSIENFNIKVLNVSQLKTKRSIATNNKLPLYIIQCTSDTDMRQLYNIKALNYQRITWENLKKKEGIMQCHKCQRFGHAAANCNLNYRCVKCSKQHKPGECQIKDQVEKTDIHCVNCKSNGHPASFKGCPIYQSALMRLRNKISDLQNHSRVTKPVIPTRVNSQQGTYAEVLKQTTSDQLTIQKLAARVDKMALVIQQQSEQISQLLSILNKI